LENQLRELIRRYIADAATQEWPVMAQRKTTLRAIPGVLAKVRIPMKPAMHSNVKPATCSDPKPAGVPI
jgi:hypothetical protein